MIKEIENTLNLPNFETINQDILDYVEFKLKTIKQRINKLNTKKTKKKLEIIKQFFEDISPNFKCDYPIITPKKPKKLAFNFLPYIPEK